MGSSSVEGCNKGIDTSVGGLVWVRRRNGSWWPGRIMGLDELPESCLVSPKAGTPVKLLGRVDASIDWYNLEKSKRVKAFRCGEYDDCITKAKISAAFSNKKAAKYARREDAILHALELESAQLGKDRPDLLSKIDFSVREHRDLATESANTLSHSGKGTEDISHDVNESSDESESVIELAQSGISFEEPNQVAAFKARLPGRRRTPNDSEDDGVEGSKRMRGLEDLGMGVLSNKKVQDAGALESIRQEDASTFGSKIGSCIVNGMNGIRGYSTSKRKRSQVPHVQEFLKKKNRRRPLTKVLESTSMVSVPVICDQFANSSGSSIGIGVSESKLSGLESNGSKKSVHTVANNNSDSTIISHEDVSASNAAEHASNGDHAMCEKKDNEALCLQELAENELSEKLYDVPLVGEEHHSRGFLPARMSYSSARTIGGSETPSGQLNHVEVLSLQHEISNELGSAGFGSLPFDSMNHRMHRGGSRWRSKGKRNSRHTNRTRKLELRENMDVDDESNTYLAGPGPSDGISRGSDQKVDSTSAIKSRFVATNQVDRVRSKSKPLSHYTRRPSTAVKQLDNGSATAQTSRKSQAADSPSRYFASDSPLYDVELEVKASYKPQHVVPLLSLMSKLNGKAIIGHPLTVEVLHAGDVATTDDKCGAADTGHTSKRKFESRKATKRKSKLPRFKKGKGRKMRKSGLLSKKTRKLSSLTGQNQNQDQSTQAVQKHESPVIACIPLKVVFSRIHEAVNGLARPATGVLSAMTM